MAEDIPGFDLDSELEELLGTNVEDLDEDTLQDLQLYKSQKLQAKRDAGISEDRPAWWGGNPAPETVEQTGGEGGSDSVSQATGTDDGESDEADQGSDTTETSQEASDTEDEESTEPDQTDSTEAGESETSGEESDQTESESEPEPEPAGTASGGGDSVTIEDTDFETDPEMEELIDEDPMELEEDVRSEVQLYKSRKYQALRDERRQGSGGGGATGGEGGVDTESDDEELPSKKAPPPTDTRKYKGERKIKDLVADRDTGREVTRRGFVSSFGLGMAGMLTAFGVGGIGTLRYFFPNVLSNPPEQFIAGTPDEFPNGSVSTRFKDDYRVWLVNLSDRIVAILAICTHLGCTPSWLSSQGIFKCPCHGSAYYMNGVNFAGPAPRPMSRVAVRLNPQGKIVVDKSKVFSPNASPGWEAEDAYIRV